MVGTAVLAVTHRLLVVQDHQKVVLVVAVEPLQTALRLVLAGTAGTDMSVWCVYE